jgi:hypothetical protein
MRGGATYSCWYDLFMCFVRFTTHGVKDRRAQNIKVFRPLAGKPCFKPPRGYRPPITAERQAAIARTDVEGAALGQRRAAVFTRDEMRER